MGSGGRFVILLIGWGRELRSTLFSGTRFLALQIIEGWFLAVIEVWEII